MQCDECRRILPAYADGELDVREALELDRHLAGCAECRGQLEAQKALAGAVRRRATYFRAPPGLDARIRAALPASRPMPAPPKASRRWSWPVPVWAGAMASVLAVAWTLGLYVVLSSADERLTDEVVSTHVRSMLGNRTVDVASSDQHTVKPWFNGKLDFSPPVRDLASEGFPLVGGRLDYLDHRPVAALVYRHAQHVINVFIAPVAGADSAPHARSENGFHTLRWTQGGMRFWAVSDVDAEQLVRLSGFLRETGDAK